MKLNIGFIILFSLSIAQEKSSAPKVISSFKYPNIKYENYTTDVDGNSFINENMSEGTGQFKRIDGDTTKDWSGGFKGDYFHGTGTLSWSKKDGSYFWEEERSYDNGKIYGKSIRRKGDGGKIIYLWKNNERFYLETVNKSRVLESKMYFNDGIISHMQNLNQNGRLESISIYENGLGSTIRTTIYRPNGNIQQRGQLNGKTFQQIGKTTGYYDDGSIGVEIYYADDGKGTEISNKTYIEQQKYDNKEYPNDSNYKNVIYYDIDPGDPLADKDGYVAMSKSEFEAKKANERALIFIYITVGIVFITVILIIAQTKFNNNMKKKYGNNPS